MPKKGKPTHGRLKPRDAKAATREKSKSKGNQLRKQSLIDRAEKIVSSTRFEVVSTMVIMVVSFVSYVWVMSDKSAS